jgi:hypothetical protein
MSLDKFRTDLMEALKPQRLEFVEGDLAHEFADTMQRFILNDPGLHRLARKPSAADTFRLLVFRGFVEVSDSYSTLRDIEALIARLRPSRSDLSPTRLLSYHIHNYLNENYILQTRLLQFPKVLLRASNRWSGQDKHLSQDLTAIVITTFKGIALVRGVHVHQVRFSDDDLDRLATLELMSPLADSALQAPLQGLFRADFAIYRRKWVDTLKKNNDEVLKLLDAYFALLSTIVFDSSGLIILPHGVRGA